MAIKYISAKLEAVFWVSFVSALAVAVIGGVYTVTVAGPAYDIPIGSHVEAAEQVDTPDRIAENLREARSEMRAAGLEPGDSAEFFPWKQTYDRGMAYQYSRLGALIERAEDVQEWREQRYVNGSEELQDVYHEKVSHLQDRVGAGDGGDVDDVGQEAFQKQEFPLAYFFPHVLFSALLVLSLVSGVVAWRIVGEKSRYSEAEFPFLLLAVWSAGVGLAGWVFVALS